MNGIQEVSGSIPLISTKKHSISLGIECFSILFSLFCAGHFHLGQQMDNRPSQFLLSYCGKEEVMASIKEEGTCNTAYMNLFLQELSKQFPQDTIMMCCDGAAWHRSGTLEVPENIVLFHIPPYTPEMNLIEQIWKEIRKRGFRNEVFATLEKVVDRLCNTICSLTPNTIFSITGRDWIIKAFN